MQRTPNRVVSDIMSPVPITIPASATPREFARTLRAHGVSSMPVVDGTGGVVGVVSHSDLLRWCLRCGLGFGVEDVIAAIADGGLDTKIDGFDLGSVADFMSEPAVTVDARDSIPNAAARMAEHKVDHVVVVDGKGQAVGLLTSLELLRQAI